MEDPQAVILAGLAILVALYVVKWQTDPLKSIPTVGGSAAPGLSLLTAFNFLRHGKELMEYGYQKYHGSVFKIALLDRWMVVVSGPKMIDELRRRPDEELSFTEGIEDTIQMKYTIGRESMEDQYHVDIIKEKLTRTLPAILPDVIDELKLAVVDYIPTEGEEWVSINVMPTMQKVVARASNRVFIGLPLCRNEEYLNLAIRFTLDVVKDTVIINLTPKLLKPLVGAIISKVKKTMAQALPQIKPMIDQRKAMAAELGDDWTDKPNDMLQWLIDEAVPRGHSDTSIIERVFLVNFAAIHTSSNSITHVLYHLAEQPELLVPLREEIEPIIAAEGWTKAAMGKMWKLDSFLKESQRFNGISLTSVTRKAMKDLTFNDGTFIPKGTILVAAAHPTHRDESNYADPDVFDPFRFARMREVAGEGTKHQFVNTSVEYMPFGHGKHACPGRFFAANELKAMMAYIVVNYDLKLGGDGKRPQNIYYASSVIPALNGQVMFRKRQVSA